MRFFVSKGTKKSAAASADLPMKSFAPALHDHSLFFDDDNRVYMAGGELRSDNGAAFGVSAIEFVSRFNVIHSVISAGAVDAVVEAELLEHDLEVVHVLQRGERLQLRLSQPPLDLGVLPDRAGGAARRIEQHDVG